MSEEEMKLYEVLFPNDNDPFYINYGYFTGGNLRKLSILKSKINNICISPILIEDEVNEGSFFIRIEQKDVELFVNEIKSLKFKEKKIPQKCINEVRALFGDN